MTQTRKNEIVDNIMALLIQLTEDDDTASTEPNEKPVEMLTIKECTEAVKGLSEHTVIYKHVFRNTMIPLVTTMAGILPSLFSGAMITEEIFALPGIGQMAYQALKAGDIPFIMGYNMFLAILTVIGTFFTDIAYMIVDPRVKLNK